MNLKEQLDVARALLSRTEIISLPKEVLELKTLLNAQDFPDPYEMERIIGSNAILAGEVVQAANLPSMQGDHPRAILSIKDAIDVLGVRRLKNLITAIALKLSIDQLGLKNLSKHSNRVAHYSAIIAKQTKILSADEAYLLGLFHNIGAFMMTRVHPEYETIFEKAITQPFTASQQEQTQYKTTHGLVGVLVAEEWELETPFKKVMVMHDEQNLRIIRNKELQQMVALVQLANCLTSEINYQSYLTPELQTMNANAISALDLSDEDMTSIRTATE